MSSESTATNWAVIHSLNFGPQPPYQTAEFFVTAVPPSATVQHVKDVLVNSGHFFGDGGKRWANYFLEPQAQWIAGWTNEFNMPDKKRATYEELMQWAIADQRITLRLTPRLHSTIVAAARSAGLSMNQQILEILMRWESSHML